MTRTIEQLEAWSKANHPTTERQVITGLILGAIILIAAISFIGERRQPIAGPATVKKDPVVCQPANHGDWFNDCSQVFAATDVLLEPATVPTKVMISYDGLVIRVNAAIPLAYHLRFFTNTPPTLAKFGGVPFVADGLFFNKRFPAVLNIGDEKIALEWDGLPHWHVREADADRALAALRGGGSVDLAYSHAMHGKGQHVTIRTKGLSAALVGLPRPKHAVARRPATATDALKLVAGHVVRNKLGVVAGELRAVASPKGKGYFVFVPNTRYYGVERKLVWFVNNEIAATLNGATKMVTPDLPYDRDASYDIWKGSNLSVNDALTIGLRTAFD